MLLSCEFLKNLLHLVGHAYDTVSIVGFHFAYIAGNVKAFTQRRIQMFNVRSCDNLLNLFLILVHLKCKTNDSVRSTSF